MADVTKERIYEVLKSIRNDVTRIDHRTDAIKAGLQAVRRPMNALQTDFHTIDVTLDRHENWLDRIERRLEISSPVLP
jgi:predicted  nucleic acid-binding Zn-ribbon protein